MIYFHVIRNTKCNLRSYLYLKRALIAQYINDMILKYILYYSMVCYRIYVFCDMEFKLF